MYLHIGKNVILKTKDIIGIFDINIQKSKEISNIVGQLAEKNQITDVSDGIKKSLILIKDGNIVKGYLSNISSVTLAKRAEENKIK